MSEFDIGGHSYRAVRINAKGQMHVMRRLAPVLPQIGAMATMFAGMQPAAAAGAETQPAPALSEMLPALAPLATAISQMTDADADYVLDTCLAVVQRRQADQWVPVWNQAAGAPMFADVELPAMLQIAGKVLQENLSGFFGGLLSSSAPPAPRQ